MNAFWTPLDGEVAHVPNEGGLIVLVNANARVGNKAYGGGPYRVDVC